MQRGFQPIACQRQLVLRGTQAYLSGNGSSIYFAMRIERLEGRIALPIAAVILSISVLGHLLCTRTRFLDFHTCKVLTFHTCCVRHCNGLTLAPTYVRLAAI